MAFHTITRQGAKRSALAAAASLFLVTTALAQSSDGSIYGTAAPGAKVLAVNKDTGVKREVTVDANGSYQMSRLPPGRYTVTANGQTMEVNVAVGSGSEATFASSDSTTAGVQRVEVVGSRINRLIDTSSSETNPVFTAEQIRALPVQRSVDAVALLAPGTVKGDDFGAGLTLPSFGGASIAENGYYINGFDVTNIRDFLSYADMPFDAIEQQQVKTGGYGAEFGRSLGGVINLSTKRGTNEWKGGISLYYTPAALRSKATDVVSKGGAQPNGEPFYTVFNSANKRSLMDANIYGGGPIISDQLFIFGLINLKNNSSDTFDSLNSTTSTHTTNRSPTGMLKIDFNPTSDHLLEITGIYNKEKAKITDYRGHTVLYEPFHTGEGEGSEQTFGGSVLTAKYTGYLTEELTLSAQIGRLSYALPSTTGARTAAGADCPRVYDSRSNPQAVTYLGCWKSATDRDPAAPPDTDVRQSWRVDLEYVLGDHTIKAGYDAASFESTQAGNTYSGGIYYRYFVTPSGLINGINAAPPGSEYVRSWYTNQTSGAFKVTNNAWYVEDSWKITKDMLAYAGLRGESFDNKNLAGQSFVSKKNLLAPRLGFAWDMNGDNSTKLYANLGRYYIPVASNTNIRQTRGEIFEVRYYTVTGNTLQLDPVTGAPLNLGPQVGETDISSDGTLPDPGTVAATNLSPMNQDELIVGLQQAINREYVAGVKGVYRKINSGMDDFCDESKIVAYAQSTGHPNANWSGCILLNPGNDLEMMMDLDGTGVLSPIKIPASTIGLAKYQRTYSALELTLDRPMRDGWGFSASYTLAFNKGTAEGYVQSNLDQADAGITQDFDFASFTHGSYGYLPNDRRHVLKFFGSYEITDEFRVGVNFVASSGRPYSCIGFVPQTVSDYAGSSDPGYSASSYYCLKDDGSGGGVTTLAGSQLVPRGTAGRTPWTNSLDLQFAYTPQWADKRLTLQMDVFNLFNSQHATEYDEVRDFSRQTTLLPGSPSQLNQNYLTPTGFQSPRSVRLTARYEF